MAWEASEDPPMLASIGALRWIMRNVVMNGAEA